MRSVGTSIFFGSGSLIVSSFILLGLLMSSEISRIDPNKFYFSETEIYLLGSLWALFGGSVQILLDDDREESTLSCNLQCIRVANVIKFFKGSVSAFIPFTVPLIFAAMHWQSEGDEKAVVIGMGCGFLSVFAVIVLLTCLDSLFKRLEQQADQDLEQAEENASQQMFQRL